MVEQVISLDGYELINTPRWNKGTAFNDHERDIFHLHGLLPPHIGNLEDQMERRLQALESQATPFNQYSYLRDLQDSNETLFYALLVRHIERMLPLVYSRQWAKAAKGSAKSGASRGGFFSAIRTGIALGKSSATRAMTT